MNGRTYAYLDLAALPAVGRALLDPRPAWVFRGDGAAVLWANAAGARFFGVDSMGALLERQIGGGNPVAKQVARLARILPTETPRLEILRFAFGFNLTALPAACRRINLPDGKSAVLAIGASDAPDESITSRSERLADIIAGEDCLVAIIAADGRVVGASGGFQSLAPASTTIDALAEAVNRGGDRIVKRPIRIAGRIRPAGVARLEANGQGFALLIVGPSEEAHVEADVPPATVVTAAAEEEPTARQGPVAAAEAPAPVAAPAHAPLPSPPPAPQRVAPAIRFLWQVDQDQKFTFVSAELGRLVGMDNADVVGSSWRNIAERLRIDPEGKVQAALDSRGHWSAIKVYWPIEDSDLAIATELSAFPIGEHGAFAGHRGFGILRPEDRKPAEPRPATPAIAPAPPAAGDTNETASTGERLPEPLDAQDGEEDVDDAARKSVEQGLRIVAGRDAEVTDETPKRRAGDRPLRPAERSNVVRLPGTQSARPAAGERLSGTEQDAFRRIAEALGVDRSGSKGAGSEERSAKAAEATQGQAAVAAEPAVQPSETETRILDRLPIGIVIFRGDKTLFANRTLLDLLGHESAADFAVAGGSDALFPDGEPDWAKPEIGKPEGALAVRRKDGSRLPVEARLQTVTWANATALMLSIRERLPQQEAVTLPEDLIEEIASVEARLGELEAILDTATDGVVVIDGRGRIINLNRSAEALFGVEAGDVLGAPFTDLLAEESRKAALDYLDGLASNGVASVLNDGREVIGKVPQGGLIPLFMTMGRVGRTGKFCAVLRDITHWKNAEEELVAARRAAEAANAQKSDFLAKISHEIRTPLNAIIGFSEVMMEERFGPVGNPRYRDYLRDIHVSGSHLMSLINDLLDLSKIEAGKLELSFESVAINETIQECVALMQPQANRERIIIRTSLSAGVPNVVADQRSLRQILLNLLSNAVKFTQAGGQVIVSTAIEDSGEVVIRIRDTGVGMSEKDIETALKPFRQLATSGRMRGEGTGLGLPLTKALVEANRAAFAIDSAVNQGTLVKVTFPTTRVLAG